MALTTGPGAAIDGVAMTGPTIFYSGTVDDPDFLMFAFWEDGLIDHDETWDCTFQSLTVFTCVVTDDMSWFFGHLGTAVWSATGTTQ